MKERFIKVTHITDWTKRSENINIPLSYFVEMNNKTLTFNYSRNILSGLEAGYYPALI